MNLEDTLFSSAQAIRHNKIIHKMDLIRNKKEGFLFVRGR